MEADEEVQEEMRLKHNPKAFHYEKN